MKGAIKTIRGKDRYFIEGKEVSKRVYFRTFRPRDGHHIVPKRKENRRRFWPMESVALKVHSKKIRAARERDKRLGAPTTEYTKAGLPIWTSKAHKDKYIRALGVHDNNSYV